MTMRLLEGELRADSSTGCTSELRRRTQASNFSLRRRWAALGPMMTVSMLNWRKQSTRVTRAESLRSTRAIRAAAFLPVTRGAMELARDFSIILWGKYMNDSGAEGVGWQSFRSPMDRYKGVITYVASRRGKSDLP